MRTDGAGVTALLMGAVAVLCCAGPLIIAGMSTAAFVAWLFKSAYVLIAGGVMALLYAVLWLRYRRIGVSDCRGIKRSSEVTK